MKAKLVLSLLCLSLLTGCNVTVNGEQVLDIKPEQIEQWKNDADKMLEGLEDANAIMEEHPDWENLPEEEQLEILKRYAGKVKEVLPSN